MLKIRAHVLSETEIFCDAIIVCRVFSFTLVIFFYYEPTVSAFGRCAKDGEIGVCVAWQFLESYT